LQAADETLSDLGASSPVEAPEDIDLDGSALLTDLVEHVEEPEAREPAQPADIGLGDVDTLGAYLRGIGRFSLLTAEREVELAKLIEAGDSADKRLVARLKPTASKRREDERLRREGEQARD